MNYRKTLYLTAISVFLAFSHVCGMDKNNDWRTVSTYNQSYDQNPMAQSTFEGTTNTPDLLTKGMTSQSDLDNNSAPRIKQSKTLATIKPKSLTKIKPKTLIKIKPTALAKLNAAKENYLKAKQHINNKKIHQGIDINDLKDYALAMKNYQACIPAENEKSKTKITKKIQDIQYVITSKELLENQTHAHQKRNYTRTILKYKKILNSKDRNIDFELNHLLTDIVELQKYLLTKNDLSINDTQETISLLSELTNLLLKNYDDHVSSDRFANLSQIIQKFQFMATIDEQNKKTIESMIDTYKKIIQKNVNYFMSTMKEGLTMSTEELNAFLPQSDPILHRYHNHIMKAFLKKQTKDESSEQKQIENEQPNREQLEKQKKQDQEDKNTIISIIRDMINSKETWDIDDLEQVLNSIPQEDESLQNYRAQIIKAIEEKQQQRVMDIDLHPTTIQTKKTSNNNNNTSNDEEENQRLVHELLQLKNEQAEQEKPEETARIEALNQEEKLIRTQLEYKLDSIPSYIKQRKFKDFNIVLKTIVDIKQYLPHYLPSKKNNFISTDIYKNILSTLSDLSKLLTTTPHDLAHNDLVTLSENLSAFSDMLEVKIIYYTDEFGFENTEFRYPINKNINPIYQIIENHLTTIQLITHACIKKIKEIQNGHSYDAIKSLNEWTKAFENSFPADNRILAPYRRQVMAAIEAKQEELQQQNSTLNQKNNIKDKTNSTTNILGKIEYKNERDINFNDTHSPNETMEDQKNIFNPLEQKTNNTTTTQPTSSNKAQTNNKQPEPNQWSFINIISWPFKAIGNIFSWLYSWLPSLR